MKSSPLIVVVAALESGRSSFSFSFYRPCPRNLTLDTKAYIRSELHRRVSAAHAGKMLPSIPILSVFKQICPLIYISPFLWTATTFKCPTIQHVPCSHQLYLARLCMLLISIPITKMQFVCRTKTHTPFRE